ncbi:hypothetical protein RRG08_057920 [Elysia crispata]|uniref:Uncharacterized protein n=1 Tax=Elysia crispata TaxID=231223 RepID=A0AAE1AAM4_9GAST|nr:hypothetical protein RRG08_057920 [Elysia crispata]
MLSVIRRINRPTRLLPTLGANRITELPDLIAKIYKVIATLGANRITELPEFIAKIYKVIATLGANRITELLEFIAKIYKSGSTYFSLLGLMSKRGFPRLRPPKQGTEQAVYSKHVHGIKLFFHGFSEMDLRIMTASVKKNTNRKLNGVSWMDSL